MSPEIMVLTKKKNVNLTMGILFAQWDVATWSNNIILALSGNASDARCPILFLVIFGNKAPGRFHQKQKNEHGMKCHTFRHPELWIFKRNRWVSGQVTQVLWKIFAFESKLHALGARKDQFIVFVSSFREISSSLTTINHYESLWITMNHHESL